MARTLIDGADQIEAGSIIRASINTATTGSALLTKLIAGTGLTLTQTGVDGGTGDVTASVSYGTIAGTAAQGNDSRITGALSASAAASTYAPIASPTFTGSVGSNGSVCAPSFSTAGSGVGYAVLFVGNATNTGYISFYDASNVRQGYIGYAAASGQIQLENEGTATGYNVTGNLTVAGTTTLSGLRPPQTPWWTPTPTPPRRQPGPR